MLIQEALEKYLNYLKLKNYTERTRETYYERLRHFIGFLFRAGIKRIEQLTKELVKEFLSERFYHINFNGKQNVPRTRSYERQTLKQFLIYLWENKLVLKNVSETVEYIQIPRHTIPRDILTKKELMSIFALPDTTTPMGYRDRMILEILYSTGIRNYEITRLKIEDIKFRDKCIFVENGKGQKDRLIPVNDTTLKYIRHYIDHIRPCFANRHTKSSTLILSCFGRPFTDRHINGTLVPRYFKTLRKKKKITFHSFRRTYATHLIQAGAPLRHVQELLGHNDLNSTVSYLQLNIKDLQKEYRRTHPVERLYKDSS